MARTSRSSVSKWRYCQPSYYLKRPQRLALLFIAFVCCSLFVWDRQTLTSEHEVEVSKLTEELTTLRNLLEEIKNAHGDALGKINIGGELPKKEVPEDPIEIERRQKVKEAMLHAWSSYEQYAWGQDELQPQSNRFSDGKVPSDMIVKELQIKEILPAYMDPKLQPQDLITGVCFASGGSGYDPLTSKLASSWSLSDQLGMLKEYIVRLQGIVGANRTNFILTRSLYLISLSSCDIANVYFGPTSRRYEYDFNSYTNLMLKYATQFLKEIHSLGARRIGVLGAPPIGCVPSQRTIAGGVRRQCGEGHNQLAMLFNAKLTTLLDSLNKDMPDSRMVYLDIYNPLLDLIDHPEKNGFKIAEKGCCGSGLIEVAPLCNPLSAICKDVNDYVFWDSFHPTERAYKIITSQVIKNGSNRLFRHQ